MVFLEKYQKENKLGFDGLMDKIITGKNCEKFVTEVYPPPFFSSYLLFNHAFKR